MVFFYPIYRFCIVVCMYRKSISVGYNYYFFFWLFKNLRPLPELCYPDLNGPTIGLWDVLLLLVEVVRLPVVYGDGEWAPEGNQHSAYCGQCGRRRQPEAQDADTAWTWILVNKYNIAS